MSSLDIQVTQGDITVTHVDLLLRSPECVILFIHLQAESPEVVTYAPGQFVRLAEYPPRPGDRRAEVTLPQEVHGWGMIMDFADNDCLVVALWRNEYKQAGERLWQMG